MSFFSKRYHEPGTAPGTLHSDNRSISPASEGVLLSSDENGVSEHRLSGDQSWSSLLSPAAVHWLHFQGAPSRRQLEALGEQQGLHALALEDVFNQGQRAKLDLYDGALFLVLQLPVLHDDKLELRQVSMFLQDRLLISFYDGDSDPFDSVRTRLHSIPAGMAGQGADYLLYLLVDLVVDQGFPVLDAYSCQLEELEEKMVQKADAALLHQLHVVKRQLILLRRSLWPQREVLGELARSELTGISSHTRMYLRDCFDHGLHIMDMLETARDMLLSLHELYLSSLSNRMNEVMRTLTVIATIFIPLTFVAGIYGMNFQTSPDNPWSMPELAWRYGYVAVMGVMAAIAVGMLVFFRRKKWL